MNQITAAMPQAELFSKWSVKLLKKTTGSDKRILATPEMAILQKSQNDLLNSAIVINFSQLLPNVELESMRSAAGDFVNGVDNIILAQQDGGEQVGQRGVVDLPETWIALGPSNEGDQGRNC